MTRAIPNRMSWAGLFGMFARLVGRPHRDRRVQELYERLPYLDAYTAHTDLRVQKDPHQAVGGMWEEVGALQYDFLIAEGLLPQHRLLDIGCGTLRAGRHFIKYLDAGNYSGLDISRNAIAYCHQLLRMENLVAKAPRLLLSVNKDLKFADFEGQQFDFMLAHSVFTHLKPEHIEECFQHIGPLMHDTSVFFFTFNHANTFTQTGRKDFSYPFVFFDSLARQYGFVLQDRSARYRGFRRQQMALLTRSDTGHDG